MYELVLMPAAQKYFKKIKEKGLKEAFSKAIAKIVSDPHIGDEKKGNLAGIFGYDVYYNHANYEIAYRIIETNGKFVVVIMIGSRENFYDELKRYLGK